jgi:dUTP pyrophosphatase
MDLCAVEDTLVRVMSIEKVPTGIKIKVPEGYEGQIRSRSGLSSRFGVWVVNQPATIDQDFVGELVIPMYNSGLQNYKIKRGDRIAQLVICPVVIASLEEVETLPATDRGENGFGSTGR